MDKFFKDFGIVSSGILNVSPREAFELVKKGFEKIANMAGGIVDWERDGLPLTTDITARLSGYCICQLKPREGRKSKKEKVKSKFIKIPSWEGQGVG